MGTFRGDETTNPTVGRPGVREQAPEFRLETVVPENALPATLAAMRAAHSYEEPAFDVIPLRPVALSVGAGRMGELANPIEINELAGRTGRAAGAWDVEIVGFHSDAPCRKVAVACGAGDDLVDDAIRAGCDSFVTGELRFHTMLKAEQAGLRVVMVGHYDSERFAVEKLTKRLAERFPGVRTWASEKERRPSTSASIRDTPSANVHWIL
jgi:putative NIF3 family GTP cyclohydrolase 1 type 2